jgi:hypothetical protein
MQVMKGREEASKALIRLNDKFDLGISASRAKAIVSAALRRNEPTIPSKVMNQILTYPKYREKIKNIQPKTANKTHGAVGKTTSARGHIKPKHIIIKKRRKS